MSYENSSGILKIEVFTSSKVPWVMRSAKKNQNN